MIIFKKSLIENQKLFLKPLYFVMICWRSAKLIIIAFFMIKEAMFWPYGCFEQVGGRGLAIWIQPVTHLIDLATTTKIINKRSFLFPVNLLKFSLTLTGLFVGFNQLFSGFSPLKPAIHIALCQSFSILKIYIHLLLMTSFNIDYCL